MQIYMCMYIYICNHVYMILGASENVVHPQTCYFHAGNYDQSVDETAYPIFKQSHKGRSLSRMVPRVLDVPL